MNPLTSTIRSLTAAAALAAAIPQGADAQPRIETRGAQQIATQGKVCTAKLEPNLVLQRVRANGTVASDYVFTRTDRGYQLTVQPPAANERDVLRANVLGTTYAPMNGAAKTPAADSIIYRRELALEPGKSSAYPFMAKLGDCTVVPVTLTYFQPGTATASRTEPRATTSRSGTQRTATATKPATTAAKPAVKDTVASDVPYTPGAMGPAKEPAYTAKDKKPVSANAAKPATSVDDAYGFIGLGYAGSQATSRIAQGTPVARDYDTGLGGLMVQAGGAKSFTYGPALWSIDGALIGDVSYARLAGAQTTDSKLPGVIPRTELAGSRLALQAQLPLRLTGKDNGLVVVPTVAYRGEEGRETGVALLENGIARMDATASVADVGALVGIGRPAAYVAAGVAARSEPDAPDFAKRPVGLEARAGLDPRLAGTRVGGQAYARSLKGTEGYAVNELGGSVVVDLGRVQLNGGLTRTATAFGGTNDVPRTNYQVGARFVF